MLRTLATTVLLFAALVSGLEYEELSFDNASLVRSNLGGHGGRCALESQCEEAQTAETPPEIYIRNVGSVRTTARLGVIDLRITNESEYRPWRSELNGLQAHAEGTFGIVNVLGPRRPGSFLYWREDAVSVQLRFRFIARETGAPVQLSQTYGAHAASIPQ